MGILYDNRPLQALSEADNPSPLQEWRVLFDACCRRDSLGDSVEFEKAGSSKERLSAPPRARRGQSKCIISHYFRLGTRNYAL